MEYSDVHQTLREARRAAGVLQEELAQSLGVTQGTLSRYETGEQAIPGPLLVAWVAKLGLRLELRSTSADVTPAA
jgi:transcriptional regulator with XRE-family HTH domain